MPMPMPRREYGMSLWVHSYLETHAGLVVNPDKGKCGAQGSWSLWGATFLGCNGRMVLVYASDPVSYPITESLLLSPRNLSAPFMLTLLWSLLKMLPHARVSKSSPVTQATLWICVHLLPPPLHLNCTHIPGYTPQQLCLLPSLKS